MKKIFVLLMIVFVAISAQSQTVKWSGFGQAKLDENNFTIPKVRLVIDGSLEDNGFISVTYNSYGEYNSDGQIELGFAQLIGKFKADWAPEIRVGRILDPGTYQFPGPNNIRVMIYPKSFMNPVCAVGAALKYKLKGLSAIAGIVNGSGKMKDNNKSLDFSSRVNYDLPFGLKVGVIYRTGNQPEGHRTLYGADLTWNFKKLWLNFGHNRMEFQEDQNGTWIFATYNIFDWLQPALMVEKHVAGQKDNINYAAGINLIPTEKTVIRINKFEKDSVKGWGILFQQSF